MSNGILSKPMVVVISAILSVGIAACDSNVTVDRASGAQARQAKRLPVEWYAARPHVLRAELDAARGRVLALHRDGVDIYDATSDEKVRSIPLPGWIWAGRTEACPPDFAVEPRGDVVVTSNVMPVLWRIDSGSLEVTRHDLAVEEQSGKDVGFSGLAYSARGNAFFAVGGLDGSLWSIDPSLVRAQRVALSASMPRACGVFVMSGVSQAGSDALCVHTELGDWTVDLAPGNRTGHAQPKQCSADSTIPRAPRQTAGPSQRGSP